MENSSLPNLLCQEDKSCLDGRGGEEEEEEEIDGLVSLNDSFFSETEDEYIGTLVSRESSFGVVVGGGGFSSGDVSPPVAGDWLRRARSDAVRWILKTCRAYFGFRLRTAYLAVTYLDRFFVRRMVDREQSWAIQLLSVACLSLAAKMVECRVPALSEYHVEEYQFDGKSIQRMELLLLNTLEWRMSSVTPFLYLNYFAPKLKCEIGAKDLFFRAIQSISAVVEAINLVDYRPSAVAAAAIFAASGRVLTKSSLEEQMGVIISICGSLKIDHVLSCYNLMIQESQQKKFMNLHKISIPSNDAPPSRSSPSVNSSVDGTDDASFITTSSKRRRLALHSYHCNLRLSNKEHSR